MIFDHLSVKRGDQLLYIDGCGYSHTNLHVVTYLGKRGNGYVAIKLASGSQVIVHGLNVYPLDSLPLSDQEYMIVIFDDHVELLPHTKEKWAELTTEFIQNEDFFIVLWGPAIQSEIVTRKLDLNLTSTATR